MNTLFAHKNGRKAERGVALLLTVSITTLLVAAALEIHRNVRTTVGLAAGVRDRIALTELATAGVHFGMAILARDKLRSQTDSLQEEWADQDGLAAAMGEIGIEPGRLKLVIEDLASKIQVNALVRFPQGRQIDARQAELWQRFLTGLLQRYGEASEQPLSTPAGDPLLPIAIINPLKDWLDSGDDDAVTGLSGAESGYYGSLEVPYPCGNGPFHHPQELLLVKNITPELYHGANQISGLGEFITVTGATADGTGVRFGGKINVNTTPVEVMAALLPLESQGLAPLMVQYREESTESGYVNDLGKSSWYKNVPGLGEVTIPADLITTKSDLFRISCRAKEKPFQVNVTGVVERLKDAESGKWYCRILRWEIE